MNPSPAGQPAPTMDPSEVERANGGTAVASRTGTGPAGEANCLHLACHRPATHTLIPQYGRRSRWCEEHGKAALAVEEQFSNRQGSGPRLTPKTERLWLPHPTHPQEVA